MLNTGNLNLDKHLLASLYLMCQLTAAMGLEKLFSCPLEVNREMAFSF